MHTTTVRVLPAALDTKLRLIRARQLGLDLLLAVALAASVLVICAVLAMLADRWFMFAAPIQRVAASGVCVCLSILTLAACLTKRVGRAVRAERAAALVDSCVPALEERWSTVTRLASAPETATGRAQAMARQVSREAAAMDSLVEVAAIASVRPVRQAGFILFACLVGGFAFLAADWSVHAHLLRRLCAPTANLPLTWIEDFTGDLPIQRGHAGTISATVKGLLPGSATLCVEQEDGVEQTLRVAVDRDIQPRIAHEIDSAQRSFRYRWRAGDARSKWHSVTVVDPPTIEEVHFQIQPPGYTGMTAYERSQIPTRVKTRAGAHFRLDLLVASEDTQVELVLSESLESADSTIVELPRDEHGWHRYESRLDADLALRVILRDGHGFTNVDPPYCRIQVLPDLPPIAKIVSRDIGTARPDDVVDIRFEAMDDGGIASAELVVYDDSVLDVDGNPAILEVRPIPLEDQRLARRVELTTRLDLTELGVADGSSISFAIRVADNRVLAAADETEGAIYPLGGIAQAGNGNSTAGLAPAAATSSQTDEGKPAETAQGSTARDPTAVDPAPTTTPEGAGVPSVEQSPANGETPSDSITSEATDKPADAGDGSGADKDSAADGQTVPPSRSNSRSTGENDNAPATSGKRPGSSDSRPVAEESPPATETRRPTVGDPTTKQGSTPTNATSISGRIDLAEASSESKRRRLVIDASFRSFGGRDFGPLRAKIGAQLKQIEEALIHAESRLDTVRLDLDETPRLLPPQQASLRGVDVDLEGTELAIGDLRRITAGTPYTFVGLKLVDIGLAHISPARDTVVMATQMAGIDASDRVASAWHDVSRALELLGGLQERYALIAQEHLLAESVDRIRKMFEIYVANAIRLVGDSRRDLNPLTRKMAELDYDEAYLQRLSEVMEMREELMAELAKMLANDPRLMRRFLEMNRRRQSSLRDDLSKLAHRQAELAAELVTWQENQDLPTASAVWNLLVGRRVDDTEYLQREVATVSERISAQMPLTVDLEGDSARKLIESADQAAVRARSMWAGLRNRGRGSSTSPEEAARDAYRAMDALHAQVAQFALDHGEEAAAFTENRRLEIEALLPQLDDWVRQAEHLAKREYHAVAEPDQARLKGDTAFLATELASIDTDLEALLEGDVPADVTAAALKLSESFEPLVLNQTAATFSLKRGQLADAQVQQEKAIAGFRSAEQAFDELRLLIVKYADEEEPDTPNAADLEDPTLDDLLAALEREPNLARLLGIPSRPTNLRFIGNWMAWANRGTYWGRRWSQFYDSTMERAADSLRADFEGPEMRHNPLASQLEDGLWQVHREAPPEEFRRAIEQYLDKLRRVVARDEER